MSNIYYWEKLAFSKVTGKQRRSQNLKEVPQNFMKAFSIDDVTANEVIQRNQHRKVKKTNLSSKVITDVKLAS